MTWPTHKQAQINQDKQTENEHDEAKDDLSREETEFVVEQAMESIDLANQFMDKYEAATGIRLLKY